MKGQLVFEFVIAALILFAIVIYIINYLSANVSVYHASFLSSYLESKALQISEVLMNDPVNGIVSEWPLLDLNKMGTLNSSCESDYVGLLEDFGLLEDIPYTRLHHMNVLVSDSDGNSYLNCGRVPPRRITRATVTRFGLLPLNEIAMLEVIVW